jgi:hypothetical protein
MGWRLGWHDAAQVNDRITFVTSKAPPTGRLANPAAKYLQIPFRGDRRQLLIVPF